MATGLVLPGRVSFPLPMWGQVKWGSPYLWHFDSYLKEHSSLTPFTQNILFLSNTYSQLSSPLSSCILSLPPNLGPLTAKCFFCLLPTKFWKDEIVWAENVSYNKTSLLWSLLACWVLSFMPGLVPISNSRVPSLTLKSYPGVLLYSYIFSHRSYPFSCHGRGEEVFLWILSFPLSFKITIHIYLPYLPI